MTRRGHSRWCTRRRGATGTLRIESKPLLDHLIVIAVDESARQAVPIQFHTGLGDPDLDLTLVDPAALRILFADRFRAAPIVLLHTGYPYIRSLAYLAAMFPNVYADMGETILFAAGEATEIYRELLGLAPASKLLFSTDASLVPELYWVGRAHRPAGARSRARRAHRRRRDRRANRRSIGRNACCGATRRRVYAL